MLRYLCIALLISCALCLCAAFEVNDKQIIYSVRIARRALAMD